MTVIKACSPAQLRRLKPYLDLCVQNLETPDYIHNDPVSFVHAFEQKDDQELAGFFAAIMAWGRRDIVLAKVQDLLERMNYQPADFIRNYDHRSQSVFDGFKHRTFKPVDVHWLTKCLQEILHSYGSFEAFWKSCYQISQETGRELMAVFHNRFFDLLPNIPHRTRKHISNPEKNSAAKRLYMYLRWMIRRNSSVDIGIMNFMPPSELVIPLDVHSTRQARVLGLLTRKTNDWKAATELTEYARLLDPSDPAKYDYALFGIGVNKQRIPDEFVINPRFLK